MTFNDQLLTGADTLRHSTRKQRHYTRCPRCFCVVKGTPNGANFRKHLVKKHGEQPFYRY
jgi:uncharacterized C2H2 Zn-finger protein